ARPHRRRRLRRDVGRRRSARHRARRSPHARRHRADSRGRLVPRPRADSAGAQLKTCNYQLSARLLITAWLLIVASCRLIVVQGRHSGETARGRRVFHFSTSRFSSAIGVSLSSTCSRSTVSLCSHTPQFFFTITSAADCWPRVSPPPACPPSSAATSRCDRCPPVFSNAA